MWKCKKCGSEVRQGLKGIFSGSSYVDKNGDWDNITMKDYDNLCSTGLECSCCKYEDGVAIEDVSIWED